MRRANSETIIHSHTRSAEKSAQTFGYTLPSCRHPHYSLADVAANASARKQESLGRLRISTEHSVLLVGDSLFPRHLRRWLHSIAHFNYLTRRLCSRSLAVYSLRSRTTCGTSESRRKLEHRLTYKTNTSFTLEWRSRGD